MLIPDLMRWLRVDLFFERSKRFIRWFIRLLPLRKINEELWFFTFWLPFVPIRQSLQTVLLLSDKGFTDARDPDSIPKYMDWIFQKSRMISTGFLCQFIGFGPELTEFGT